MHDVVTQAKGYIMFVRPSEENLRQEYHVECVLKGLDLGTFDEFLEVANASELVEVDVEFDRRIANRSRTRTQDQLLGLIRNYRSYPEFRNEATVQNLYDRIGAGLEMTAPLVIRKNGRYRVLAGNTRLDVAFQLGKTPSVLLMDFDK